MADASAPIDFRLLTQTAQRTFSERFPQKERRKGGEEGEEEGEEEEEEEAELEEGGSGGGGGGGRRMTEANASHLQPTTKAPPLFLSF